MSSNKGNNPLGEFVKKYRIEHKLSLRALGSMCDHLSHTAIDTIEKGYDPRTGKPANITDETFRKLAVGMGVPIERLLAIKLGVSSNIDDGIKNAIPNNIIPMPKTKKVPLVGSIACGTPKLASQNVEGDVDLPEHIHADFALRCNGDSMINARIFNGDIVYIRQQSTVDNGDIAAVLIDEDATLKRVRLYPDHVSLEAENPMYPPIVKWGEEMEHVRILGKAVAFTSSVK